MFRDRSIVPMVMFHSVGLERTDWLWSHLSEPVDLFESKIRALVDAGYSTIFWEDLYRHMSGEHVLRDNSIALTFDDGYLDNWVYVYPILKKYGVKATIFVNPEFVDPISGTRPRNEGDNVVDAIEASGFLGWDEMREMQASGLVDIQSHAMSHTWYFGSPELVDFHHPGDRYPWLAWNRYPERKPYYMREDQSGLVPFGHPVFVFNKSLVAPRFEPDAEVVDAVIEHAAALEPELWQDGRWRLEMQGAWSRISGDAPACGTLESESDYHDRIRYELGESRRIISSELDKPVDFICWPGGGYNDDVIRIAREVGYRSWTLSSRDRSDARNRPGSVPQCVKRIGSTPDIQARGYSLGPARGPYFLRKVKAHQRSLIDDLTLKAQHAAGIVVKRLVG